MFSARSRIEAFATPPPDWIQIEKPDPDSLIEMVFALKQQNIDALKSTLLEVQCTCSHDDTHSISPQVSDPTSAKYGQYLTLDEVGQLIAPLPESVAAVERWLSSADLDLSQAQVSHNKDFITIGATIAHAEILMVPVF